MIHGIAVIGETSASFDLKRCSQSLMRDRLRFTDHHSHNASVIFVLVLFQKCHLFLLSLHISKNAALLLSSTFLLVQFLSLI